MGAIEGQQVDHKNPEATLDNRRQNLRLAALIENCWNRSKSAGMTSKFKGVSWDKRENKWKVEVKANKKRFNIGRFADELQAARAYDAFARQQHGEFAQLNFPKEAA